MPLVYADRVQVTTLSTGTGALTLLGAVSGFQDFSVIGVGNTTYYTITDAITNAWEVGEGTVGVGSLTRDTVLASSNANALVNFGVGSKSVFSVSPATFYAAALSTTGHAAINHTGLPGVPAPEAFTGPVHATTNHTAITGVGNLATAPGTGVVDHATVNHAGLPGVPAAEAFTAGVHATTNHAGITGVGLTTKQILEWPHGISHVYYTPRLDVPGTYIASNTLVALAAQSSKSYSVDSVIGSVLEFGANDTFSSISPNAGWSQNLRPRLVVKFNLEALNVGTVSIGLGINGQLQIAVDTIYILSQSNISSGDWHIVSIRSSPPNGFNVNTGIPFSQPLYAMFEVLPDFSYTVSLYNASTFALLHTSTIIPSQSPALSNPANTTFSMLTLSGPVLKLGSMLLSFK